ncbi:MAG: ribonuclease E/G [Hyphomicrobiaceae bacterium]
MEKNRMLIDATHPEETRVVAVRNGRVEDFDFESAARKLLRGNIYLAKVTRVEPSLQAAFVDYGGNRHGFLAFNEIHPDYYQIPVADREALKQEEADADAAEEAEVEARARSRDSRRRRRGRGERPGTGEQPNVGDHRSGGDGKRGRSAAQRTHRNRAHVRQSDVTEQADVVEGNGEDGEGVKLLQPIGAPPVPAMPRPVPGAAAEVREDKAPDEVVAEGSSAEDEVADDRHHDGHDHHDDGHDDDGDRSVDDDEDADDAVSADSSEDDLVEHVGSDDDALEEVPERTRRRARQYKIQEVIKRRQILLVQVVKEERGNKGAALTTYISLAGRYTVLMPNTGRGGGISRKITQPQDRKRLKAIAEDLDVPEGMGLIIRTAGAARTKQEVKRDYEYLLRLWESVREVTLSSTAPCLVYEEGSIVKRAIRDLYSKDFDQIVVAGKGAHREAQDFMEMLMPGSGGHVAAYRDPEPLFARHGVERQLNALFSPYVTLKSGGYIVINQTEALVSVDVNSGKSTREFSIEETALNTNIEAAEELSRQLKLRDLAGLIVVDFIDMEEKRNNRTVERRLKDALRHDRARIQVGRISHFGLLEMSRQRLRAGVLEGSTSQCPHCQGTGIIRSIESVALAVLRGLEDHLIKQTSSLVAATTAEVALYILNHKRTYIVDMERRYGVQVRVEASDRMHGANFEVERFAAPVEQIKASAAVSMEWGFDRDTDHDDRDDADEEQTSHRLDESADGDGERRGRRRRRRRGRRDREGEAREQSASEPGEQFAIGRDYDEEQNGDQVQSADAADDDTDDEHGERDGGKHASEDGESRGGRRGRRRGRRGGRSRRREGQGAGGDMPVSLDDPDRHEWGIADIARPGAEQPSAEDADIYTSGRDQGATRRSSIVETVDDPANFSASDEAVRLAVRLAGGGGRDDKWRRRGSGRRRRSGDRSRQTQQQERTASAMAGQAAAGGMLKALVAPPVPAPIRIRIPQPPIAAMVHAHEQVTEVLEVRSVTTLNGANGVHAEDDAAVGVVSNGKIPAPPSAPAPETLASKEPPRPARKGWWQRRFGGE